MTDGRSRRWYALIHTIPLGTTQHGLDLAGLCCYYLRRRPSSFDYAYRFVAILAPCIQTNASSLYLPYNILWRDCSVRKYRLVRFIARYMRMPDGLLL